MVNRTLGNRYQVTEKIGMGGMAEVYKATDSTLGRTVAVKVMLPQYASDPNFAARFRQEAQAAANLSSPYIVNIYDWGRDGDSYYIVMEYVRGTDLKTAIQQRGNIHPRKVAEIGSQVCSALSVAHGYDIIHRDIKSANIMVQGDGNVKVMDFGIAQAGHPGMTQDSSVLGTAHYVSPEQAQGKKLTPASDLYSLGIVLYEAATGQLPFDGPDVVSVAMKQVSDLPVPPRQLNPNIDPQFEAIIMTALEKNPDDRFATAKEMQRAIDDYLSGRSSAETQVLNHGYAAAGAGAYGVDQTTVMPTPGQTTIMPGGGRQGGMQPQPQQRNNTARNIIIALVAIVLIAGIGFFVANAAGLFGGGSATVPNVQGQTEQEARRSLTNAGLKVGKIKLDISETVEKGKVISQNPTPNSHVEPGTAVDLVISSGKTSSELVTVPNLRGLTASEAEQQLAALGLVGESKQDSSDTVEAGKVCEQDPAVNSQVEAGSKVTYTVSTGKKKENVLVPSVLGIGEVDAVSALEGRGLSVSVDYESSTSASQGEVIRQSISGGTEVAKGSSITITVAVSPYPSEPTTPDTPGGDGEGNTGGDTTGGDASGGGEGDSATS
ncbi:MAG: Stk1 family PASTA domain-containing Ser/Thr kinase [Coriobacteriales bacterium]